METQCNHNINDKDHTIKINNKMNMTYPPSKAGRCKVCKVFVSFVKIDGEWIEQ